MRYPQSEDRNSITLLEDSQDSPSRPSDNSNMQIKTLE